MKKIILTLSLAVISYFNAFAQMTPEAAADYIDWYNEDPEKL